MLLSSNTNQKPGNKSHTMNHSQPIQLQIQLQKGQRSDDVCDNVSIEDLEENYRGDNRNPNHKQEMESDRHSNLRSYSSDGKRGKFSGDKKSPGRGEFPSQHHRMSFQLSPDEKMDNTEIIENTYNGPNTTKERNIDLASFRVESTDVGELLHSVDLNNTKSQFNATPELIKNQISNKFHMKDLQNFVNNNNQSQQQDHDKKTKNVYKMDLKIENDDIEVYEKAFNNHSNNLNLQRAINFDEQQIKVPIHNQEDLSEKLNTKNLDQEIDEKSCKNSTNKSHLRLGLNMPMINSQKNTRHHSPYVHQSVQINKEDYVTKSSPENGDLNTSKYSEIDKNNPLIKHFDLNKETNNINIFEKNLMESELVDKQQVSLILEKNLLGQEALESKISASGRGRNNKEESDRDELNGNIGKQSIDSLVYSQKTIKENSKEHTTRESSSLYT